MPPLGVRSVDGPAARTRMKPTFLIAAVLNWSVVAALAFVGVDFLTSEQIKPYHEEVLDVAWDNLPPRTRLLIMTLMKGTGMVAIVGAVSLGTLLAVPFRRQEPWSRYAILIIGGTVLLPTLLGALRVRYETGAPSPWWQ